MSHTDAQVIVFVITLAKNNEGFFLPFKTYFMHVNMVHYIINIVSTHLVEHVAVS